MNLSTNHTSSKRRWLKFLIAVAIIVLLILATGLIGARIWYGQNLRPISSDTEIVRVEIPLDSSLDSIATLLESKGLIRNQLAFKTYVRGREFGDSLKAGVYELNKSQSVQEIVSILISGDEASDLVTIPPGARLDQVKERLEKSGFESTEIDAAFNPELYKQHPALVAKPHDASLEGYLYPETFNITSSTKVKDIIEQSLDQMAARMTPDLIQAFARQGLSPHEAVILASVIEREVPQTYDRRVVAQIFLKRLKEGIPLGADATYVYAATITGEHPHPDLDNPYNTRKYTGLPPGPISNVDEAALQAVANPTDTEYLFFVSGDDGTNYFAMTQEEHEANIKNHCEKNCGN